MKKSIKKLDKRVIQALTQACEEAKLKIKGFSWLTHHADYQHFPNSLVVTCLFETNEELARVKGGTELQVLVGMIDTHLTNIGIKLAKPDKHLHLDSEQACESEHKGNWVRRLSGF